MRVNGCASSPFRGRPAEVPSIEGRRAGTRGSRLSARLAVESLAARAAAKLSRLAGAGGGTTLPGKLLWKLDPGAIDALAARLPRRRRGRLRHERQDDDDRDGRRDPRAGHRLAWNRSGREPRLRGRLHPPAERDAELGLLEVDEGALPEIARRIRPRAVLLGNLFRDQLDRYGELEHIAERWRTATAALPPETVLVVNGDDPQVGDLARDRSNAIAYGIDDPRHARPTLQHAADSRYCVRCGQPYEFAAAYVGHLGDYRCPACGHARPALQVRATRDRARRAARRLVPARDAGRATPPPAAAPGLYNVYNALGAAALAQASARRSRRSGTGSSASAPPSAASSASRRATRRCSCC